MRRLGVERRGRGCGGGGFVRDVGGGKCRFICANCILLFSEVVAYVFVGVVEKLEFELGFFVGESCFFSVVFVWVIYAAETSEFDFCFSVCCV